MKSGTLIWALCAIGTSGSLVPQEHEVVQEFINGLKRNPQFDWNRPPSVGTSTTSEPTGWPWTLRCNPAYFSILKQLAQLPPGSGRDEPPKIDIFFVPYVERAIINFGDVDVAMNAEHATTSVESKSDGWQVGAQLMPGSKGIGISAGYSESWTTGVYQTKTLSVQSVCKSGFECHIETWTFHIKISGHCKLRPFINGDGEADACLHSWTPSTQQFEEFTKKHCLQTAPYGPYRYEPCEVTTPLLDHAGQPFTRQVHISKSINRETVLKAIKEEGGWYLLSNGEWYDPSDNTYYGNQDDKWYSKPEAIVPDLSKLSAATRVHTTTQDSQRPRPAETGARKARPPPSFANSPELSRFAHLPRIAEILSKRSGKRGTNSERKKPTGAPIVEVKFLDDSPLSR